MYQMKNKGYILRPFCTKGMTRNLEQFLLETEERTETVINMAHSLLSLVASRTGIIKQSHFIPCGIKSKSLAGGMGILHSRMRSWNIPCYNYTSEPSLQYFPPTKSFSVYL